MIFTPTNTPKGTVKAARCKSETRFKSAVRPPTVNMLQPRNEFPDSTGRRAHRLQSCPCRTSPTKYVSIRRCPPRQRRSSGRREPHFGTRSFHLLRRVNHPARRIRMFWRMPRASSMCWATTVVPRFLSGDAFHANTLTSHKNCKYAA